MTSMNFSRRALLMTLTAAALSTPAIHLARAFGVPPSSRIAPLARRKGVAFGSAVDVNDLGHDDLKALYRDHCTSLTPRNAMKWTATEKRRAEFSFSGADKIVDFAAENQMQVHGHTLVWHNVPSNVKAIESPRELEAVMRRHVDTQVRHFAGKVHAWDVVNEPLEYDSGEIRQSEFLKLLGERYITSSLQAARTADPKAILLINETHLEKRGTIYDKKRAAFLELLDKQITDGAPLDGIGLQGHFRPGLDALDEREFGKFCAEITKRNLVVYITELDASCRFISRDKGFTPEDYGTIFEQVIGTAARNGRLKGVTVWGLSERYAEAVTSESTATCSKRINLYDENDVARNTLAGIIRAYEAMPDA